MAIWDNVKRQLRSVIEWENPNHDVLFSLWSANGDEIKNASKLLVKPGQGVVFTYEGKVQAVHLKEGLYEIKTANIPFLTTLTKFMQGFESEHKVGISFFWQTEFLNQKWGTTGAVKYIDPQFGFPVALRAYGNFSMRITDAATFFVNIVGARAELPLADIRAAFVQRLVQPLSDTLAESALSVVQIDAQRNEIAALLLGHLKPEFSKLGFEITDFRIEGTEFDEETQQRINTVANIQADAAGAKAAGVSYVQMQQLKALREAATNEGGVAGAGVAMGAGVGLGQAMAAGMASAAPAAGPTVGGPAERMKQLDNLKQAGLISQAEYDAKRAEILKAL